jgi:hypothetical protein
MLAQHIPEQPAVVWLLHQPNLSPAIGQAAT